MSSTPERPRSRVEVALTPLFGVERDLGQRAQDLPDRRGERVADGELDDRHGGNVGHAPGQASHEVERLQLGLLETGVRCLLRPRRDGRQLSRVPALGLPTEVGQIRVVAGNAVERAGQGVGVEDRRQELGSEFVSGHRGRLPRAVAPASSVIRVKSLPQTVLISLAWACRGSWLHAVCNGFL